MDVHEIRRVSKRLLGNRYRLEVAAAIGSSVSEIFHAQELVDAVSTAHNLITPQLKFFVDAGLLREVDSVPGSKYVYYERLPTVYWELCRQLLEELRQGAMSAMHGTDTLPTA